jgi:anti-anti-sigma factor
MIQILETSPRLRICRISGELDAQGVSESGLQTILENLTEQWDGDIDVDLQHVTFMDSSGVGALVFLFKRLSAAGRKLTIVGANGAPLRLIEMLRLDKSIPMRHLPVDNADTFHEKTLVPVL